MVNENFKLGLFWGTIIVTIIYILSLFSIGIIGKIIGLLMVFGLFRLSCKYISEEDVDKYAKNKYLNKIIKKIRELCKKDLDL